MDLLQGLITKLKDTSRPDWREALRHLRKLGPDAVAEVVPLLAQALDAEDHMVRIRAALALVEQHAVITATPPMDSPRRGAAAAKQVVQRAIFFATHHIATQTSALGAATVWLGTAAADRIEGLERRIRQTDQGLRREIEELRARIEHLERDR